MIQDKNYYEFLKAIENNDNAKAKAMVENNIVEADKYFSRALWYASSEGNEEMVEFLLPMSDATSNDSEALKVASRSGYVNIVKMLIPFSDVNAQENFCILSAIKNKHFKIVELFLKEIDPDSEVVEEIILNLMECEQDDLCVKAIDKFKEKIQDHHNLICYNSKTKNIKTMNALVSNFEGKKMVKPMINALISNNEKMVDILFEACCVKTIETKMEKIKINNSAIKYFFEKMDVYKTKEKLKENMEKTSKKSKMKII